MTAIKIIEAHYPDELERQVNNFLGELSQAPIHIHIDRTAPESGVPSIAVIHYYTAYNEPV